MVDLNQRKSEVQQAGKAARDFIVSLTDELSFVELDTFAFSKSDFFEEAADVGAGVVTGFARIGDKPIYLAVQNEHDHKGGMTKAQADKILKAMTQAEKAEAPFVLVLSGKGARIGEGLAVMDGFARLAAKASALYGEIPLITVIRGDTFGSAAFVAAQSDFVFTVGEAQLATNSSAVIAAKKPDLKAADVAGPKAQAENGSCSVRVADAAELRIKLNELLDLLSGEIAEVSEDSLNYSCAGLNEGYDPEKILSCVLDPGSFFELNAGFGEEVRIGLGRAGGFTVGVLLCADETNGVKIGNAAARKISRFARLLECYGIPLVSFVNASGTAVCPGAERHGLMREVGSMMSAITDLCAPKISVVCKKAQGAGYMALAAKGLGFDYVLAWPEAEISLLSDEVALNTVYAAELAASKDPETARAELAEKYARLESDPMNAAKDGLIDNIIEPSTTRQYLISALMMLTA